MRIPKFAYYLAKVAYKVLTPRIKSTAVKSTKSEKYKLKYKI